jgi:hypothetical protein
MDWYYADGSQQKGPITEEGLADLVRAGTVKPDTLVWRAGLAGWQPYSQAAGGASAAGASGLVTCSQCGKAVAADQVIRYGEQAVCAECKPAFMQRIKEGLAPASGRPGSATPEDLCARDYEVSIGDNFSKGWDTFKAGAGVCIGVMLVMMAIQIFLTLVGLIPIIGLVASLASLVLGGPLSGGTEYFFLQRVRGQDAGVGVAFSGFGPRFVNLMLTQIVAGILAGFCIVPGVLIMVIGGVVGSAARGSPAVAVMAVGGLLLLIGLAGAIYLGVSWSFALLLAIDKRMGFWAAMQLSRRVVGRHWWMVLAFMFVGGLFAALGVLACLLGLFVTVPTFMAMKASLYERLFGDMAQQDG